MLISGKEKLERMRDGRAIYIGAERVQTSPATPRSETRRRPLPASTSSKPILNGTNCSRSRRTANVTACIGCVAAIARTWPDGCAR